VRVLEPTAGDGAFVRGLASAGAELRGRVSDVCAIEVIASEAAEAELSLRASGLPGRVVRDSVLRWAADTDEWFELVLGNPPFVRYQFVPAQEKAAIVRLGARLGLTFGGVGNLWIPVLLGALARLRPGGALAVVLPSECFTGRSAALVRRWLAREVDGLTFDLFAPGSFPGALQEVVVLSGRRARETRARSAGVRIVEHGRDGGSRAWAYQPNCDDAGWTRALLEPRHLEALELARSLSGVTQLDRVARLEVSTVTGANEFFCVDERTLAEHDLQAWAKPLLARARHAPGVVLTGADHADARARGARSWLLDFDADAPNPARRARAGAYLREGVRLGLDGRYKCRIREPWYRVPSIRRGSLLLSKRSHLYPRLLLNEAALHTTDTIYRGAMRDGQAMSAADLVASFHCSLTLLSVELEGRSFGGGVLELVPSEIARLSVVRGCDLGRHLPELDRIARGGEPEELVAATDSLLVERGLLARELTELLAEARHALLARRLQRNALAASHGRM
jgi:adenine-specific DNA-methyltransferase